MLTGLSCCDSRRKKVKEQELICGHSSIEQAYAPSGHRAS